MLKLAMPTRTQAGIEGAPHLFRGLQKKQMSSSWLGICGLCSAGLGYQLAWASIPQCSPRFHVLLSWRAVAVAASGPV